jgi:uncharacterized protein YggE
MKRVTSLIVLVFFIQGVYSQDDNSESLKIIGKAKKLITPDLVTFNFNMNVKDKNQSSAQTILLQETNRLIARLKELGYNENEIKFISLDIEDDWDYSGDKSKKVGYIASDELELTFFYEPIKVSQFIDSIGKSNFKYLDYTLKLEISESLKNSTRDFLIENAIMSAKRNAESISKSANVVLDGINYIEYRDLVFNIISHDDAPPPPPPAQINRSINLRLNLDYISLRDMEVYEEVMIIWKIKNVR